MEPSHYAFHVANENLASFINMAQRSDSMSGNQIVTIKDMDSYSIVVIKRMYDYPYIINELRELGDLK